MKGTLIAGRILAWAAVVFAALIILAVGLVAVADTAMGRPLLIRGLALFIQRPITVNGALETRLLDSAPRVSAEHVIIGNPAWTPAGVALEADKISIVLRLPGWRRSGGITAIDIQGASLHLLRDAAGRANWQWRDPAIRRINSNSAIVRSLSIAKARVQLDDAKRHLQFVGIVSAQDINGQGTAQPLRIDGAGQLNGRPATFRISADSLLTASHRLPYHFTFAERSGDSHLEVTGFLPQPFIVDIADATFVASGPDLKDLYFLTGVHLLDTGEYRLSGKYSRRGTHTTFSELAASSGSSDIRGSVVTDSASGRPRFDVLLDSQVLKLSDLGLRAAGRLPGPPSPLLLSDAMISPNVLHVAGAAAKYHANRVEVGRLDLKDVSLTATISQDVLTVSPLAASLSGGRVDARLSLDGSKEVPAAVADIGIFGLQLGPLLQKGSAPPPMEGALQIRVSVRGLGRSVHQVAASANGTLTVRMTGGALRESLAELTDVDLRGLRLLLFKNKRDVPVRCGIARFKAEDGTLTAQDLWVDTDPVLITGEGRIHLDSEGLDLAIRGNPKSLRLLRLQAPVLVQGTLAHPSIHVAVKQSRLRLIDRGQALDRDCTEASP
ncbi:MAG TPA: AsmA family protein [Steroidobacteraceae bacterium]|nr:AsmA family protein [Steroidobacteraceae bacterium]